MKRGSLRERQLVMPWEGGLDPRLLREQEWLVTNGLGGYASGTLAGTLSRKYHGLFVPNLATPRGRHVVISRCDEFVTIRGNRIHLGGAELAGDRAIGDSHRHLKEFRLDGRTPVWVFDVDGVALEKSIVMPHQHNTVCVRYRLLHGASVSLEIRPYLSFRRHDETPAADADAEFESSLVEQGAEFRRLDSPIVLRMAVQPERTTFAKHALEESACFYRIDFDRGDAHLERARSPGFFKIDVDTNTPALLVASTQPWASMQIDSHAAFAAEAARIDRLLSMTPDSVGDPLTQQLVMAADQFVILPAGRLSEAPRADEAGSELRTVIAGYHWFGDWGRDTMISLEGLTLCTGRHKEAGAILRTFANYVRDGLLPNLFPEGERQALYHTVDATLWYFHAISRYVETSGDTRILGELFPVLASIVDHYTKGTHFNIGVDAADGMVTAAAEGYQLTWMDAKVDGWVVTPRRGKPVEIQALWYNALRLMASWSRVLGHAPEVYERSARRAQTSFNRRFWNDRDGCLFDLVDGPDGADAAVRPNQLFAVSLDFPILLRDRWPAVVETVRRELVTPYGLRTLSSSHPDFKPHYRGNLRARDAAYHQGTVWPWLIGHFIDAFMKVDGDPAVARSMLHGFEDHLFDAGIGSISEIFDATPPYQPGGCAAQAWSVAEVLRSRLKVRTR